MDNYLERAINIASEAHVGQIDKGGEPYILHPLRVMYKMDTHEEMATAVLHDVIEDTDVTTAILRHFEIPEDVIIAVDLLTKKEGQDYYDYMQLIKHNRVAIKVKIADLEDNMDITRLDNLGEPLSTHKQLTKYLRNYHSLKGILK